MNLRPLNAACLTNAINSGKCTKTDDAERETPSHFAPIRHKPRRKKKYPEQILGGKFSRKGGGEVNSRKICRHDSREWVGGRLGGKLAAPIIARVTLAVSVLMLPSLSTLQAECLV